MHTEDVLYPPNHVKLTPHFLYQANERMPREDVMALWDLILSGALFEAAAKLEPPSPGADNRGELYQRDPGRGERAQVNGAVCLGRSWVVFCVDSRDRRVLVLKTALTPSQSCIISRRTDTHVVRLPELSPRLVDTHGLGVKLTMVGVELSTPDGELVLGLTDEEAAELSLSIQTALGSGAERERPQNGADALPSSVEKESS